MLITALHPGNDWPELDAEFLSNLSPAHILTTHSQDALHRLAGGGYAGAAGLRDGAAGQHSIQLLGCRLGDPHHTELLLRERQRSVNIAETHVTRRRSNHRRSGGGYR